MLAWPSPSSCSTDQRKVSEDVEATQRLSVVGSTRAAAKARQQAFCVQSLNSMQSLNSTHQGWSSPWLAPGLSQMIQEV